MQSSLFNTKVRVSETDVFLMNTLTDAQVVVSADVAELLDRLDADHGTAPTLDATERTAVEELASHGFVVSDREEERAALDTFFDTVKASRDEMHVTVLTTLQCNFACDYCMQGDHGEWNESVTKMDLPTAERVGDWLATRLDAVGPRKLALMFFGGEPLLNLEALYAIAERAWRETQARGVTMELNIITNGLLLTPEVVDRLEPFGLTGIKVTLDGDRATHDTMRPLRGGQPTFDRIIENIRQVADRCRIAIGGNFDEASVASYPALLDFLREQSFADSLVKVAFKPIMSTGPARRTSDPPAAPGLIPLTPVDAGGAPLAGGCMTAAGAGAGSSPCDSCHFLDEQMSFLREETKKRGFPTLDGVHMGPCEIHMKHAYTVGTDGSLFACPGFATETAESVGHIDSHRQADASRAAAAVRFEALRPWQECGDCEFIPVCGGGCSVAAHHELGDMHQPSCHKSSFESAVISMAQEAVAVS